MKTVDGFRLREIMGQAVVIGEGIKQIDFNKLVTLNRSASYLWQSVEGKDFELSELVDLLVDRYGVERVHVEEDVKKIVTQWIDLGLVKL
jgi:hypothetical protein